MNWIRARWSELVKGAHSVTGALRLMVEVLFLVLVLALGLLVVGGLLGMLAATIGGVIGAGVWGFESVLRLLG